MTIKQTPAEMQAQAQQAKQAYLQQAQQAQQNQALQQQGVQHGGYWYSSSTTPSGTSSSAYIAYVGAAGTLYYTSGPSAIEPDSAGYPPIEEAGIRAGEIIGYRAWKLNGDLLHSMYVDYDWLPGVQKIKEPSINCIGGNGFYAFKELTKARMGYPGGLGYTTVYGEVALWGEVYEHERGYRAECARVTRLIAIEEDMRTLTRLRLWKESTLDRLRRIYGVEE